jgi:hypothetical protein
LVDVRNDIEFVQQDGEVLKLDATRASKAAAAAAVVPFRLWLSRGEKASAWKHPYF